MKRALAFALFAALTSAPALAIGGISIGHISPAIHTITLSSLNLHILGVTAKRDQSSITFGPQNNFASRPIQCETTVYSPDNGFFVPHQMTYASLGSCPLLPVTFIDNVAPVPQPLLGRTGFRPILIPADDFDF